MSSAAPSSSTATKLLQAAALAAVLVPLGSVAVETANINCISQGSGCAGSYFGGSGAQTNTWKFFSDSGPNATLFYTIEIAGTPLTTFNLNVEDVVTTQGSLVFGPGFGSAVCVPTFDGTQCGLFAIRNFSGTVDWLNGYLMTITWRTTSPASQPPNDGFNTILRALDPNAPVFTEALTNIIYDPSPTPTDPGISGRGDDFSTVGVFRTTAVPEPASLLLVGTGIVGILHRRRRRKRLS